MALGSQGLKGRSASAGAAVRLIAGTTAASAPFGPKAVDNVVSAVLALMEQRPSRGPLGPLEIAVPLDVPTEPAIPVESGASSRKSGKRSA